MVIAKAKDIPFIVEWVVEVHKPQNFEELIKYLKYHVDVSHVASYEEGCGMIELNADTMLMLMYEVSKDKSEMLEQAVTSNINFMKKRKELK